MSLSASNTRRFVLRRVTDVSGVSGTGVVAEGIQFTNGWCALTWLTPATSCGVYPNLVELERIHGHNGATVVEFVDHPNSPDLDVVLALLDELLDEVGDMLPEDVVRDIEGVLEGQPLAPRGCAEACDYAEAMDFIRSIQERLYNEPFNRGGSEFIVELTGKVNDFLGTDEPSGPETDPLSDAAFTLAFLELDPTTVKGAPADDPVKESLPEIDPPELVSLRARFAELQDLILRLPVRYGVGSRAGDPPSALVTVDSKAWDEVLALHARLAARA